MFAFPGQLAGVLADVQQAGLRAIVGLAGWEPTEYLLAVTKHRATVLAFGGIDEPRFNRDWPEDRIIALYRDAKILFPRVPIFCNYSILQLPPPIKAHKGCDWVGYTPDYGHGGITIPALGLPYLILVDGWGQPGWDFRTNSRLGRGCFIAVRCDELRTRKLHQSDATCRADPQCRGLFIFIWRASAAIGSKGVRDMPGVRPAFEQIGRSYR